MGKPRVYRYRPPGPLAEKPLDPELPETGIGISRQPFFGYHPCPMRQLSPLQCGHTLGFGITLAFPSETYPA